MSNRLDVAVIGAEGPVGSAIMEMLAERRFPANEVSVLALEPDEDATAEFAGRSLLVEDAAGFEFSQVQLAFLCGEDPRLMAIAERAADAGCVIVDASGMDWQDSQIPRVIAEINPRDLGRFNDRGIVAAPDRLLVPLMLAIQPLAGLGTLRRLTATAIVPASDGGRAALEDLARETTALLNARHYQRTHFPQQIAFNVLGQIGLAGAEGRTEREAVIVSDLRELLQLPELAVGIHLVQAASFYGYGIAVELQFDAAVDLHAAQTALRSAAGVILVDSLDPAEIPSPVVDAAAEPAVRIARLRPGADADCLALWVSADNVRRAAAMNAVVCAEMLVREFL
ncbi:MAG TPA: Asd/ArgC dimerization domain-containing protein [Fontimonas sp.]